jgi:hypothetical protein
VFFTDKETEAEGHCITHPGTGALGVGLSFHPGSHDSKLAPITSSLLLCGT